ncbi:MAG: zinc metallopeptidase [Pirellulales bacterium]
MFYFDPLYLLFMAPAFLLAFLAQIMVQSAYARGRGVGARMSGFAAARRVLDSQGLYDVAIEQVPGHLSDHYDPRDKVLRLSPEVYHGLTASSVGIAAHEAGHALQDAHRYAPLMIRNAAVPMANFGSSFGLIMLMIGLGFGFSFLAWAGLILFSTVAFFQIVNLPVEFDASSRAKVALQELGICDDEEMYYVRKVLNAAALTYVAATLQSVLTVLYYLVRLGAFSSNRDD